MQIESIPSRAAIWILCLAYLPRCLSITKLGTLTPCSMRSCATRTTYSLSTTGRQTAPQRCSMRHGYSRSATREESRLWGRIKTAFDYAIEQKYDVLVTIDCDGQHEPQRIGQLVAACRDADMVSGSRYLRNKENSHQAPAERRQINTQITRELNELLGLSLTDAFCGFKAYRVPALAKLTITESGYGMPLEVWVQAVHHGLRVVELPVPLIYLEEERSFGGSLDDGRRRLEYYHRVIDAALAAAKSDAHNDSDQSTGNQSKTGCGCS